MKRGLGALPVVNTRTEQIIRFAGFLVPIVLFLYGLLLHLGAVTNTHRFIPSVFYTICIGWIAISVYQFLFPSQTKRGAVAILAVYHILAVAYILCVSGFEMPFIATWAVLFLATYAYLGRDMLNMSILILFATAVADILQNMDQPEFIIRSGLHFLGTLIAGYTAGTVTAASEVDRLELSRSQAEELLQRDRILTLINNITDAVLSTDSDGIIEVYNAAALGLLDTNSDLKGQHIDSVLRLIDQENRQFKFERSFRTIRSVESREDLSATISGETIHLSVIYSPIRGADSHTSDTTDGYIVILRDITKQKSLEEERDEFISVVSHELRTPISIAEGSLSNIQVMMDRSDIPKSTLVENVKVSHDQVLFLARMANDLSTLSRAERGVADAPENIDVTELIHDLYKECAPEAQAKGLQLNLDLQPQLGAASASRLYLKELLQNFVTNAIKYTKQGEVLVSVRGDARSLEFKVKDSGIGISKSDQQHIYDKFWRSEDYRTRETGGTGLGLYVSTKLAKKLGTHIELTSRLNHGSTFSFTIPRK